MSGEFVARMEDVLDLYEEEYDPERPVVCFDETSKQLIGDTRPSIRSEPGDLSVTTTSTGATAHAICSCYANRRVAGDMLRSPGDGPRWTLLGR